MAFSYTQDTGDGVTKSFVFAFTGQDEGYLRESDIVVTVDGASVPFTLTSSNTLELSTAPADGAVILIRRVMPKAQTFSDFSRGNNFGPEILNNSFLQLLYVVHELLDGWFPEGFTVREAVEFLEDLSVKANLYVEGEVTVGASDPNNPDSVVTYDKADERYINADGDAMDGPLNVRLPVQGTEPARKDQLDQEVSDRESAISQVVSDYQDADANLQSQLTGETPLEASAFSEISWHGQVVESSVTIPDNKNAWSFGPLMSIAEGQAVTVGEGSHWTIAEGNTDATNTTLGNYDEGVL